MKAFKLRELMIHVQPACGPGCSLSCNGNPSVIPCQLPNSGICEAACSLPGTLCHPCSIVGNTCVGCSAIACSVHPCSINICSAHPCSAFPCSAHPCSVFPCSAHPCSANPCSVNVCSAFPCSAHPCSINVCSAHPCSAIACSVIACSGHPCTIGACSVIACSAAACSIRVSVICPPASICPAQSAIPTPPPGGGPGPVESIANLAALKEQLKQHLAAVEEHEKTVGESLKPQTVAEVDDLQAKLQGAMDELKARRAELEKQEKNKGKEPAK